MPSPFAYETTRILLIEDDRDDEMLSLRALRTCGRPFEVRVARNGLCARRMLGLDEKSRSSPCWMPHLVLSDLKLPGIDGYDLLCSVRADHAFDDVSFMIFSSSNEACDIQRCLHCGADAYVRKPVCFDEYTRGLQTAVCWALEGFDPYGTPSCVEVRAERTVAGRRA